MILFFGSLKKDSFIKKAKYFSLTIFKGDVAMEKTQNKILLCILLGSLAVPFTGCTKKEKHAGTGAVVGGAVGAGVGGIAGGGGGAVAGGAIGAGLGALIGASTTKDSKDKKHHKKEKKSKVRKKGKEVKKGI